MNPCKSSDDASGRSAAPLFVHFVCGIKSKFEKGARIGEKINAFTGGQTRLGMLTINCFLASSFTDLLLFVPNLRDQVRQRAHVGFETKRAGVDFRREYVVDVQCRGIGMFAHEDWFGNDRETTYYTSAEAPKMHVWEGNSAARQLYVTSDATILERTVLERKIFKRTI